MLDISSIINTQAIPAFLLPLNGLLCGVFYTRYSNINARIHHLQNFLREFLDKHNKDSKRHKTQFKAAKHELDHLHKRAKLILVSLCFLLTSIVGFCSSAIFITLTVKNPNYFSIAITLWFLGPFLIVLGIISALKELLMSKISMRIQSKLLEELVTLEDSSPI